MGRNISTRRCEGCDAVFQPKPMGFNAKYCNRACAERLRRSHFTEKDKQQVREWRNESFKRTQNDPGRRKQHLENSKKSVKKVRTWLADYKASKGCKDCGFNLHSSALQLDHEGKKSADISSLRSSIRRLQEEIVKGKCVVRCANCHSIRTWAQKNNMDYHTLRKSLLNGQSDTI